MARVHDLQSRKTVGSGGLLSKARKFLEEKQRESSIEDSDIDNSDDIFEEVDFGEDSPQEAGSNQDFNSVEMKVGQETQEDIFEKTDETEADIRDDFTPQPVLILPQILAGIGSISRGIDAPYLAYGILRDMLGIRRGMLLLQDHADDRLVPFCSTGFEYDTLEHFKISPSDYGKLKTGGFISEQSDIDPWKKMFSVRESELLDSICAIPCGNDKKALLLITDSPILTINQSQLELIQASVGDAMGKMLLKNRWDMLDGIKPVFLISQTEFPSYLNRAINSSESLIIGLPVIQLTQAITKNAPGILNGRIEKDCLRVMGSIVQDEGAVSMDAEYFYLVFEDVSGLEYQIISDQLEFSLQQAFSTALPGLDFHIFSGEELRDLGTKFKLHP